MSIEPLPPSDDPSHSPLEGSVAPLTLLPPVPVRAPERRLGPGVLLSLAIVAVFGGSILFVSGFSLGRQVATTPGTPVSEAAEFQAFWDAYRAVTERYAGGPVDRKELVEGAIKGMIAALDDPFSQYLTSQEYRDSLRGISATFEGIGANIATAGPDGKSTTCSPISDTCLLVITSPVEDSPAEKAGLEAGDVIDAIDGMATAGLSVDDATGRIRGPRDSVVTLRIVRNHGAPFDVTLTRAVIIQKEVSNKALADGDVGYIKLTGFSEHAVDEMTAAVTSDVNAGQNKLILDLRGNPGGFVTAAQKIASQFISSGVLFWQEDAKGTLTETDALAGGAATDPKIRLVVLVDGGSASASEIVAAALQERGRAQLVGEKTYGKGTVQQWTPLEGDNGGFRLTVAKWLTPDKNWIHKHGIVPDVVVPASDPVTGTDSILDRALELLGDQASGTWSLAA